MLGAHLGCYDARGAVEAPAYDEVRVVLGRHCLPCHSEQPTVAAFPVAPSGVVLDTPEQTRRYAERIRARAVVERSMPLLNKTQMTDDERGVLGRWVEAGASSR